MIGWTAVSAGVLLIGGGVAAGIALRPLTPPPLGPGALTSPPLQAPVGPPSPSPTPLTHRPLRFVPGKMRVMIPSIGVDAGIVRLGLNADGSLQVPSDYATAGWWSGGPLPGERGPAVVVGHVDSKAGPAVFFKLATLQPGRTVEVSRPDESTARFVVTRLMEVSKSAFPTKLVYGPTSDAELRLVTCGGSFDSSTGHYVDNVIVFAKLRSIAAA